MKGQQLATVIDDNEAVPLTNEMLPDIKRSQVVNIFGKKAEGRPSDPLLLYYLMFLSYSAAAACALATSSVSTGVTPDSALPLASERRPLSAALAVGRSAARASCSLT